MAPSSRRPKRNQGPLSVERILNSSSPILNKDIQAFLVTCVLGWSTNYADDEKRAIIATLPPPYQVYDTNSAGELLCPISADFVLGDPFVKSSVGKFKRDVQEGYYEMAWQNKAKKAMQERREGKFDDYLREQAEECFGEAGEDEAKHGDEASSESDWGRQTAAKSGKRDGGLRNGRPKSCKDTAEGTNAEDQSGMKLLSEDAVITTRSGRRSTRPSTVEKSLGNSL